jgi:hypothetical protein
MNKKDSIPLTARNKKDRSNMEKTAYLADELKKYWYEEVSKKKSVV